MNHPMDKMMKELLDAAADGPEAMEGWLKDLQEEVGAPDGPELPETLTLEYEDGTVETIDTTKPLAGQGRLPTVYNFDNPHPLDKVAFPDKDKDE